LTNEQDLRSPGFKDSCEVFTLLWKSPKRNRCAEFHAFPKLRQYLFIEEGRAHTRFKNRVLKLFFSNLNALHHELISTIRIMDIVWTMMDIKELGCLGHRAAQRIVAASPFLLFVEANCRLKGPCA